MCEGFEDLPILIRTTTNADHDASARRSRHFNSPIIANDSTPLSASPHQQLDTSLREPTPTTPMFRLPSSNISPCLLQLAKQRSHQDLEKDIRASVCLWSWLRGLTLFFFFSWFVHFSHFGLWNIFDSGVWITWKTKKEKHYQGQVTVWALKPMKKFDSFNYCSLSTIANNHF